MIQISKHIIEAYLIHRSLTRIKDDQMSQDSGITKKVSFNPLWYINVDNGRVLKLTSDLSHYCSYANKNFVSKVIQNFISTIIIQPNKETERNISWAELYVLFRLRGGPKVVQEAGTVAVGKCTAAKLLMTFRKNVKAVTSRILQDSEDLVLFNQTSGPKDALRGIGIQGKIPTLGFNVAVSERESKEMAIALVRLTRTLATINIAKFMKGSDRSTL